MKIINDIMGTDTWFIDKNNLVGPLTMAFKSGAKIYAPKHFHRSIHEYYIVLDGEATIFINDKKIRLKPKSVVIVEPGEIHSITDATNDFKVILIMEKFVPNDKVEVSE